MRPSQRLTDRPACPAFFAFPQYDMSKYKCCQGYSPCSGDCVNEASNPDLCLVRPRRPEEAACEPNHFFVAWQDLAPSMSLLASP